MILVDSSVLIDIQCDRTTLATERLQRLVEDEQAIGIGDLMLVEVLQGIRSDRAFREAVAWLSRFEQVRISDHRTARRAAEHYRILRAHGVTVRKTIDTLIATRCILDGLPLLYSDGDFDPFVQHLGLISAMAISPE